MLFSFILLSVVDFWISNFKDRIGVIWFLELMFWAQRHVVNAGGWSLDS